MAVHLSIGRIPSILLLALLGPAVAAGAAHYLSGPGPETAPAFQTAPASQIVVAVPPAPAFAETIAVEPAPAAVAEAEAEVEVEVALKAEIEAVIAVVVAAAAEVEAAPAAEVEAAPAAEVVRAAPAGPVANAGHSETGPAVAPVAAAPAPAPVAAPVAPPAPAPVAPPAAAQGRVTVARLVVEPQGSPAPRDLAVSTLRPRNQAPIPTRAPRAAKAGSIAVRSVAALFQSGAEIRIEQDANLYITTRNIPDNDRLLAAYNAERPNGGRVQTRAGEATAVPGLLGIAKQAHRAQDPSGRNDKTYSLADAMRDAIWRKNTAARLKSLITAQNACGDDTARRPPSIGLLASC